MSASRAERASPWARARGLSLVEVVAAVAILAMALSYLVPIAQSARQRGGQTRDTLEARLVAARRLEEVVLDLAAGSGGEDEDYAGITWEREETEVPVVGERKVLRVRLVVRYEVAGRERPEEIVLTTYARAPEEATGGNFHGDRRR